MCDLVQKYASEFAKEEVEKAAKAEARIAQVEAENERLKKELEKLRAQAK